MSYTQILKENQSKNMRLEDVQVDLVFSNSLDIKRVVARYFQHALSNSPQAP